MRPTAIRPGQGAADLPQPFNVVVTPTFRVVPDAGVPMPITTQCESCGKRMGIPEKYAGKVIRCPACKSTLRVPDPTRSFKPVAAPPPSAAVPRAATPPSTARLQTPAHPNPTSTTTTRMVKPQVRDVKERPVQSSSSTPPSSRKSAPQKEHPAGSTPCPYCRAPITQGSISCGECGYHLKLKRRIVLSTALRSMESMEMTSSGGSSRRIQTIESHRESGKRKARGMILGLISAIVLLTLAFTISVRQYMKPQPLPVLVEQSRISPLRRNLKTFHPYYAGQTVTLTVSLSDIVFEPATYQETRTEGDPARAWMNFAASLNLPYYRASDVVFGRNADSVIHAIQFQRGTFSPSRIEAHDIQLDELALVRGHSSPRERGYLQGILLDFGQNYALGVSRIRDAQLEMQRHQSTPRQAGRPLPTLNSSATLTGVLTFIPVSRELLLGRDDLWSAALLDGGTSLHRDSTPKEPLGADGDRIVYFCPVLVVTNIMVVPDAPPNHFF